ncbi:hypothetical protein [Streptomyces sp. CA-179760]|uniref:hypothetical protein n=1 Tax=Streptomyces sp. CA-179760 TaxID=3240054 RepID=UPI003D92EC02
MPDNQIQRLLQPFQKLAPDRHGHREGYGLGLAIVNAVTQAHHATLTTTAPPKAACPSPFGSRTHLTRTSAGEAAWQGRWAGASVRPSSDSGTTRSARPGSPSVARKLRICQASAGGTQRRGGRR